MGIWVLGVSTESNRRPSMGSCKLGFDFSSCWKQPLMFSLASFYRNSFVACALQVVIDLRDRKASFKTLNCVCRSSSTWTTRALATIWAARSAAFIFNSIPIIAGPVSVKSNGWQLKTVHQDLTQLIVYPHFTPLAQKHENSSGPCGTAIFIAGNSKNKSSLEFSFPCPMALCLIEIAN